MKANVKPAAPDMIVVRGVQLKFNGMDERDLKRWQDVGAEVERKYPGALDLPGELGALLTQNVSDDGNINDGVPSLDMAQKYADGTKAFCELWDGVFGEGTSTKVFGEDPYYGLCLEIYYELLGAVQRQGLEYGRRIENNLAKIVPFGPSGEKK